jgi:hypothetical protein
VSVTPSPATLWIQPADRRTATAAASWSSVETGIG